MNTDIEEFGRLCNPKQVTSMKWPLVCLASIPPVEPYLSEHRAAPNNYDSQLSFAVILFEREQYYTALYNQYSQYGEEPPADHHSTWEPFPVTTTTRTMLRELRQWHSGDAPPEQPYDLFGLKEESFASLTAVLRPAETHRLGYLIACRFSADLCRQDDARTFGQVMSRLGPRRRRPLSTLAAEDATIDELRRHAWHVRTKTEGDRFTHFIKTEREFCEEERERIMAEFNSQQVPDSLRTLIPMARRFGIGDDPCRAYFLNQVSKQNRRRIWQEVEPHLETIDQWVKTFHVGRLPSEAAAFFWLLQAVEEMRLAEYF